MMQSDNQLRSDAIESSPDVGMSSVENEMKRLNDSIDMLDVSLRILDDKLSPVVIHTPAEEYAHMNTGLGMCRLAEQVYAVNDRVRQQIRFVEILNTHINLEGPELK